MEWFANEDFWRDLYPYMFPPERLASAAGEVSKILELTGRPGVRVLDLCCGPGRHAVEFARQGFQVTGVDKSPFLLEQARRRASEEGVSAEWILEDMRNFRRPAGFDLACSLFTSFGFFDSEEEDLQVLRNVAASLSETGVFIMDVISKERLANIWKDAICTGFPDGAQLWQRPQVRNDWTRIRNQWMLAKDGVTRSYYFEHSIYSGRELKDRLLASGFARVRLFGDLGGSEYGIDATRLIAVATLR